MNTQIKISPQFWLLLTLVLFLVLPIPAVLLPDAFHIIFPLFYSLLVLSGIRAVTEGKRGHSIFFFILGGLAFVMVWITFFSASTHLLECTKVLSLLAFFIYLSFLLYGKVGRNKEVNLEVIFAAISGYLLLGLIGGFLFQGLELIMPHSFNLSYTTSNLYDLNYLSFVTLTTLGFGDILPLNQAAKSLVVLLSLAGQLYLTILVAILVGKFLTRGR